MNSLNPPMNYLTTDTHAVCQQINMSPCVSELQWDEKARDRVINRERERKLSCLCHRGRRLFNRKHISFSILCLHQNCKMLLLLILDEVFRWPNVREAKSHLMANENISAFKIKALVAAF